MSIRHACLAAFVLVAAVTSASATSDTAALDQRLAEIEASLAQARADALAGRIKDARLYAELQKSLESEKALILERRALLERLESAPAPAPAEPVPTADASASEAPAAAPAPSGPLALIPLTRVKPNIPDALCRRRASGWVELDFAVMPDGTVREARVARSEPAGAFDAAALEAVAQRTYPPQDAPVKLRERLPMSFADCRSEQLRAQAPSADGPVPPQEDCPVIAAEARTTGDAIAREESSRAVLSGIQAQAYSAPSEHCFVPGRTFKPGNRLVAHVEYKGFSLVSAPKSNEFVWVWSNQLKDVTP